MPELQRKTGGLTALGVAAVLLGGLWIVAGAWGLLQPETIRAQVARVRRAPLLTGIGLVGAYACASVTVGLGGWLLAAGVGLLKLRRWGAALARRYAVAQIGWSVVAALLALLGPVANRPGAEQIRRLPPAHAQVMRESFLPTAVTMTLAALVLSVLFAVILLALLSRETYKENLA